MRLTGPDPGPTPGTRAWTWPASMDTHHQGFAQEGCPTTQSMGRKALAAPLVHPRVQAEIMELCHRGDQYLRLVPPSELATRLTDLRDHFDTTLS